MKNDSNGILKDNNDENCKMDRGRGHTFKIDKKIVRIEYPGNIRSIDRAMDTLGGLNNIEMAVANLNNLYLHFHPNNKYNKPCIGDRDVNPGILIKIKKKTHSDDGNNIDYEVLGVSTINYKFNRLCDFQLVPVVSEKDHCEAEGEVMYEKICPKEIPSLDWFVSKEISTQCKFYVPQLFSRFDVSNNTLYLNAGEKFNMFTNSIKPDSLSANENKVYKKTYVSAKKLSVYLNIIHPDTKIPEEPSDFIIALIKKRGLLEVYKKINKFFEQRPIWTKAAIMYTTKISNDYARNILPAVGYYCTMGPWRTCWIKYGYNPLKESGSRIYQTLDFRIRTADGVSIKVFPKRASTRYYGVSQGNFSVQEERCFILRPHIVPPARQMFYQYCDLLIPEIQDMLQRLPKVSTGTKFDLKNGWLPASFTEQCREIANKYVLEAALEEVRKESQTIQQNVVEDQVASGSQDDETSNDNEPSSYCSLMLSNIRKGIYKSVNILPLKTEPKNVSDKETLEKFDTVDLVEDTMQEEMDINDIPETMSEPSEDELSDELELDIDLEAVEEINELIDNAKKDFHQINQ